MSRAMPRVRNFENGPWAQALLCVLVSFLTIPLAVSCAGSPDSPAPGRASPQASPSARPKTESSPLASLPPAARDFLLELQDRVHAGDWAWAADHADSSFLRALEGQARDAYFYTYLFSAGTLSVETADESKRFESVPLAKVRNLAWDEAGLDGPVAIVKGRFLLSQGPAVPFTLRLLWRLEPPRILGVQP